MDESDKISTIRLEETEQEEVMIVDNAGQSTSVTMEETKQEEVTVLEDAPEPTTSKISFNITKKVKKMITVPHSEHQEIDDSLKEEITHLANGLINGKPKPKKVEPVIPRLSQGNDWRIQRLQKAIDEGTATDDQKALLELLLEGTGQKAAPAIEKHHVELRPEANSLTAEDEEPEEPDYEQISYADFGEAFLRGRGWKKEEGVGRTNKRVVPLVIHAKGKTFDMGIKKKKPNEASEPEIPLKPGVAVKIIGGKFEGAYGRVSDFDTAAERCEVKLADGTTKTVVEKFLQTISDKEYTENTKILNKGTYDKCKEPNDKGVQLQRGISKPKVESKSSKISDLPPTSKRKDYDVDVEDNSKPPWAAPDLLVRIISKDYKDGRYYREKMIVVDASSRNHIELKDDRGRIHTVKESCLETVIPRGVGGRVMLLRGRHRGRVGVVSDRDDRRYRLGVRVLGVKDLIGADFNDVCEFCGNIEDMDY